MGSFWKNWEIFMCVTKIQVKKYMLQPDPMQIVEVKDLLHLEKWN